MSLHFLIYNGEKLDRCFPRCLDVSQGLNSRVLEVSYSSLGAGKRFCLEGKWLVKASLKSEGMGQPPADFIQLGPLSWAFFSMKSTASPSAAALPGPAPMQERNPDRQWGTRGKAQLGPSCPHLVQGQIGLGKQFLRGQSSLVGTGEFWSWLCFCLS